LVKYVGLEVEGFIEEFESRLEVTESCNYSHKLRSTHVPKEIASLDASTMFVI
jgi:hypothetical protein